MADFEMIPADGLLARVEEQLSTFAANGLLDIGTLYPEIAWFNNLLSLAVYEQKDTLLKLDNYRQELPCDFFLLDSAWLCDRANTSHAQLNFQSSLTVYTETTKETVGNDVNCGLPNPSSLGYLNISACNMDTPVYDKTVTKEYVYSGVNPITWRNPQLLSYKKGKSLAKHCAKDCENLFSRFPDEISINKHNDIYYLYSTLKEPIIYVLYYAYPIDPETKTPLIPNDEILEKCLFKHLVYQTLLKIWTNGEDANLENKIKFWKEESELAIAQAMNYSKLPSFNKMVQLTKRSRRKFFSFETLNSNHF